MKIFKIIFLITINFSILGQKYINIFIHGTTRPHLSVQNLTSIWKQHGVERSSYATITNYFRRSNTFKKYQAMQGLGLEKIELCSIFKGHGAGAIAFLFDYFSRINNPTIENEFYTFGWSGMLSAKERLIAGKRLYRAIARLERNARIMGEHVHVRVITYSHGGGVTLNTARARKKPKIKIESVIVLGMPIQYDTDYLINSDIFENFYHFYSLSDYVQTIDHLSSEYFACHRRFASRKNFILPFKLKQIRLQVTKYLTTDCKCNNECIIDHSAVKSYHLNPGHGELWGLGWTSSGYRKGFPLYPLPVVVTTPLLIDNIRSLKNCSESLIVDIKPFKEIVNIIEEKKNYCTIHTFDFIKRKDFICLKNKLWADFKPEEDLSKEYEETLRAGIDYSNRIHNLCDFDACKECPLKSLD